jgi:cobalt-zinc-cadmium resistance protein CzcA
MTWAVALAHSGKGTAPGLLAVLTMAGFVTMQKPGSLAEGLASPSPVIEIITRNTDRFDAGENGRADPSIEVQMAEAPNVASVQATSLPGVSDVRVRFDAGVNRDQARRLTMARLGDRLRRAGEATPRISFGESALETIRYRLVGRPGYSTTDLWTLQDSQLRRRFQSTPGVMGVSGWVGPAKTYEITIDVVSLRKRGVTLTAVMTAICNSRLNAAGQTAEFRQGAVVVRGVGTSQALQRLREVTLRSADGQLVRLNDLTPIAVVDVPSLDLSGPRGGAETVQGVVLARESDPDGTTIHGVEDEFGVIRSVGALPPGVTLKRFDERGGAEALGGLAHLVGDVSGCGCL